MDNKGELIIRLAQMLQHKEPKGSVIRMPSSDCVKNANKDVGKIVQTNALRNFFNVRLELSGLETCRANCFLLMPFSNSQWKVFVVDSDDTPYGQLDDYDGVIIKKNGDEDEEYNETFVISVANKKQ